MSIKQKERDVLCTKSGNRCALPDCRAILVKDAEKVDPASLIAEAAHIKGENLGSARYDKNMTDEERNSYENLILLCPSCHTKIDKQPSVFPEELLHKYKKEHETWIINSTKSAIVKITFLELDIVTKHLVANPGTFNDSLTIIPPRAKIDKNGLTHSTEQLILMGMTQVRQVADFIGKVDSLNPSFSSALVNGFVAEYKRLYENEGLVSDVLFETLHEFSCNGSSDFRQRAAGLSVLVYLFEKCEVFEK